MGGPQKTHRNQKRKESEALRKAQRQSQLPRALGAAPNGRSREDWFLTLHWQGVIKAKNINI